jgi:peptide/nickel transport system substrate-binding protein
MRIHVTAVLAAATAVGLAFTLTACSGTTAAPSGAAGGTSGASASGATIPLLRAGLDFTLSSLDEPKNIAADNVVGLSLETLVKFSPQGQVEPDLATSWDQTSPVTYVYHLRHDAKFWDGKPVTATDVAYSLNYDRASGSDVAFGFTGVKSIVATDPYTVTVTLSQPEANWKYVPAEENAFIFEKAFQQAHAATFGQPGTLVMGSGPWIVDSLDPTKGAQVSANPHWWGGRVPIQHISVKLFASETSEALAFRGGQIDVATNVLNPKAFKSTSGGSIVSAPAFSEGYFGMNVHQAPWNDIHVRRAIAYALNRSDIIAALGNNAQPVTTLIPSAELDRLGSQAQVSALINALPSYPYNLAKAKQELAESAYPHGFTATTQTITFASYTPVNEAVAGDLAKIGINLKLKTIGFTQYLAFASGPKSAIGGLYATMNVTNPDPDSFPSALLGSVNIADGGYDWANYDPPVIDTLIKAGETTQDSAQRLAIYGQMLKTLATDLPYVPLYIQDYNVALSSQFTWPNYDVYTQWGDWELNIKPKN